MYGEKNKLAYRKKVRTYSKRLATALSTASLIGYIAASVFNISWLSLCFTAFGIALSAASFGLNLWSRADHFRKCELIGIENSPGQKKLTKIHLDIMSNILFLAGGITSILPFESPIIPWISTTFFILGCAFMVTNLVRTMISEPKIDQNNNSKSSSCFDSQPATIGAYMLIS